MKLKTINLSKENSRFLSKFIESFGFQIANENYFFDERGFALYDGDFYAAWMKDSIVGRQSKEVSIEEFTKFVLNEHQNIRNRYPF